MRPPRKISPLLEKCVGYSLKLLDIVQKIWAPLTKLLVSQAGYGPVYEDKALEEERN